VSAIRPAGRTRRSRSCPRPRRARAEGLQRHDPGLHPHRDRRCNRQPHVAADPAAHPGDDAGFGGFEGGYATGFSFKLAGVDRTNNANWFYNSAYGSPVQREFKAATHVEGATVLNI
jgi:hypothetical protein